MCIAISSSSRSLFIHDRFVISLICSSQRAILSLSSRTSMINLDFFSKNFTKSSNSEGVKYFFKNVLTTSDRLEMFSCSDLASSNWACSFCFLISRTSWKVEDNSILHYYVKVPNLCSKSLDHNFQYGPVSKSIWTARAILISLFDLTIFFERAQNTEYQ